MSVLALCGGTAFSQSQLDAFKYSQTELNGTARYLGTNFRKQLQWGCFLCL